jgi:carboxymethylenebutenolidase
MGETIRIEQFDHSGEFMGYLATPASGRGPGVVVIQEIFGVNAGIRAICDAWAEKGFVALAPDIFWRLEPGVELDPLTEEAWTRGIQLMQQFSMDNGVKDIAAAIRALRSRPECTGKVGVTGYCMGGLLTFLAATRTDADAAASYYGAGTDKFVNEQHGIGKPLIIHLAMEDEYIPADAQAAIHAALDGNPHVTVYDYPGTQHAFARVNGAHRDEEAAKLAEERTLAFFREHLA